MSAPTSNDTRAALAADLAAIDVAVQAPELDRIIAFATLLTKWNAKIRLVGPSDLHTIVREQVVDAMGFAPAIEALDSDAYWDIGAGGGLPGVLMALRYPDRRFIMVEPIHKKTAFLQHAAQSLGIANMQVHTGRVNAKGVIEPAMRLHDRPSAAFSRATLGPEEWLPTATRLVGPDGIVLIAAVDQLPPIVHNDPDTIEIGRWHWTVPATAAPRLLVARRVGTSRT